MTIERRLRHLIRRIGAYFLDVVLLFPLIAASQALLFVLGLNPIAADPTPWRLHPWVVATVTIPVLLYFALTTSRFGATLGQRLLKLQVTRTTSDERIAPVPSLLRAAVMLTPWELIHTAIFHRWWWALALAYVWLGALVLSAAIDREGRGAHDRLAGAKVTPRTQAA